MAHATPLSRRSLLAISAAALAGTASVGTSGVLAQSAAPSLDAALIEICAQFEALRLEFRRACDDREAAEQGAFDKYSHLGSPDFWGEVHHDPAYAEADERTTDIVRRTHPLFQAIGQMRAVTMEAIMAKARVTASACLEDDGIEEEAAQYNEGVTPQHMALTLVRDLLAMHSAGRLRPLHPLSTGAGAFMPRA